MTDRSAEKAIDMGNAWVETATITIQRLTINAGAAIAAFIAERTIGEGSIRSVFGIQGVISAIISIQGLKIITADICIPDITINITDICIHGMTTGIADICIPVITTGIADICIPGITTGIADICIPDLTIGITDTGNTGKQFLNRSV